MFARFTLGLAIMLAMCGMAFAQPVGSIDGLVLLGNPQGGPAAGATVVAMLPDRDSLVTTADEAGHFGFAELMPGLYPLFAHLDDAFGGAMVMVMANHESHVTIILGTDEPLENGSVSGNVALPDGQAVEGAHVHLSGFRGNGHGEHGRHYETVTGADGGFNFPSVEAGPYTITASAMGLGFDSDVIEVFPNQNTVANLVLEDHNGGGHHGHDWDSISVSGTVDIDTVIDDRGMVFIRYELDTDGDGGPNWFLDFGPPNYNPDNGATRPNDGDVVTVTGWWNDNNPFGPDLIWVTSINGVFWRGAPDNHGGGDHGGGGHHGDTLEVVSVEGTAIVVQENPARPARYFLDIDSDGQADFRLCFGPPWYNPNNGATRPANGDQVAIVGGLLAYGEPQAIVVYEINGMFWREPFRGHGGHGGDGRGCRPDSLVRTEAEGIAIVHGNGEDRNHYFLDTDGNEEPNYILDFGGPDYDPGNGAVRPADGDEVFVVGGMFSCDRVPFPVIVVYEINGLWWRDPGDTLGLGSQLEVSEPNPIGLPSTYLTASNYPNPFNPTTTINYSIPASSLVQIRVFDLLGREVEMLFNGYQSAGSYEMQWNAASQPTGLYFYEVTAGNHTFVNRMMLLK